MESLVNYESDGENEIANENVMSLRRRDENNLDTNYDDVGMDESDEESNNNYPVEIICESILENDCNTAGSLADAPLDFRPYKYRDEFHLSSLDRRHSIDMEMDDGSSDEDDAAGLGDERKSNESEKSVSAKSGKSQKGQDKSISCEADSSTNILETEENIVVTLSESFRAVEKRKESRKPSRERDSSDRKRQHSPSRREKNVKRAHCPDKNGRDRSSHYRENSRSPDRSWKSWRVDKRIESNRSSVDSSSDKTPREVGDQLKAQIKEIEAKTGVTIPTYYNPGVMNPLKYAQQVQKRKLLWGNKTNDSKVKNNVSSIATPWDGATFKGDSDGKMTEKFKRLMGMKTETSGSNPSANGEKRDIIEKQEEMFSNMEAQYQVARMVTHTLRGVGLGYGYQNRPPLQKNS